MDELKLLVDMVAALPAMALWVIAFFFGYKVVVVGSIYGVIRFVSTELFGWLATEKAREVEYKEIRPMLDGMCIRAQTDYLISQLHRLKGIGTVNGSEYIHRSSIDWLREAIDDKIAKDAAKKGAA